jgi:hypothetical protein
MHPITVWIDGDPVQARTVDGALSVRMPAHQVAGQVTTALDNTGFIVATADQKVHGWNISPLALWELPPKATYNTIPPSLGIVDASRTVSQAAPGFCYLSSDNSLGQPCLSATSAVDSATLTWAAPDSPSPIKTYTIQRGNAVNPTQEIGTPITCPCANRSFTDKKLARGTYYYTVTAANDDNLTTVSNQVKVQIPLATVPGRSTAKVPPRSRSHTRSRVATASAIPVIQVSWTVPPDGGSPIDGYDLLRGTASGGETYLASTDPTQTSYVDTAVTSGTTYYYEAVAVNAVGDSEPSNEVGAAPYIPSVPQPPVISGTGGDQMVQLAWPAPADGGLPITGYNIYKGTRSGAENYVASVPAGALSYADSRVTAGITYFYRVTATNLIGESQASNEVSITPSGPNPCQLANHVTWTGGAGTSDWADAANWSTGTLPGPSNNVCIPTTSLPSISSSGQVTINSIETSTPLVLTGGSPSNNQVASFTLASTTSPSYFHAGLTLTGFNDLAVSGPATVDDGSQLSWTGEGSLSGTGTLQISPKATLDLTTACVIDVGCPTFAGATIANQGNLIIDGTLLTGPGGTIDNTGTLTVTDQGCLGIDCGGGSGVATIISSGTIQKTSGTGTGTLQADLRLSGPVQALAGILELSQMGTTPASSAFTVATGATLAIGGSGTMSFTASEPVTGGGTFLLAPGNETVILAQPIGVPAITVQGGTLSLGTGLRPDSLTISSGQVIGSGSVTLGSGSQFAFSGGALGGSVNLSIAAGGSLTWSGGTMGGTGVTTIAAGATVLLPAGGAADIAGTRELDTSGTVTQDADLRTEGGTITNAGTWALAGDVSFVPYGPAPVTFTNTGTLAKTAGTGTSQLAQAIDNSGVIELTTGTLATDTFTQSAQGVLLLELTGSTPGTSFGVLTVSGTATLSGTLQIADPGYQPPPGSSYEFLSYQTLSRAFTTVGSPSGGPTFSLGYDPAGASATVPR